MPTASSMAEYLQDTCETQRVHSRVRSAYDVADRDTPETLLGPQESNDLLHAAVSGLKPQHAQLIELRYDLDMTFEEIGRQWGVTESAVSRMHDRALNCLKQSLALMGCASWSELP